ncbi:MAG: hypothetical protein JWQ87_3037 [Candidatus Sulfotelmatobacter sp.]|nr:hypothetical protein [Candidatus Sulfotelmatobacter sp.]
MIIEMQEGNANTELSFQRCLRFAVSYYLMPDGLSDSNFQILKVNVIPAECQKFADSQAGCRVEQCQGALSDGQLAQEQLEFAQFENVRNFLSLRALTNELDRVAVNPLVTHRVMKESTHEVPNLRFCSLRPLDAAKPLLNCNRFDLINL